MDIAVAEPRPVDELDAELERGLGARHQLALVDADAPVEEADVRQRRLAHPDDADLARLDQPDVALRRSVDGRERRGRHPPGRTTADDHDPERGRHGLRFSWACKEKGAPYFIRRAPLASETRFTGSDSGRPIAGAYRRSEERRVGKECRSRWSAYQ